MKYDKYTVQASRSFLTYEFRSEGPKGVITKRVRFVELEEYPGVFNLTFGDKEDDGRINYFVVTDNKDSERILATVVLTVVKFFEVYPDKMVYFVGSTTARTRLYRMGITRYLSDVEKDFHIFGLIGDEYHRFKIGVGYEGFLIQKKK